MDFPFGCSFHSLRHILVLRKTRDGAVDLEKNQGLWGAHRALQTFSARGAAASFFFFGISSLFNSQQECFPVVGAGEDSTVEIILAMHPDPHKIDQELIPCRIQSIVNGSRFRLCGRSVG